ncbi:MAG: MFS transporter, partial [Planctomycetota bacterium]
FCLGLAAIFSASISFLAARVSRAQAAEMIGMIGSAGFAGMLIGAHVADFLVSLGGSERQAIDRLFYGATVLTLVAVPFAWAATRKERPTGRSVRHSAWRITLQYSRLPVVITAAVVGAAFAIPFSFLASYAKELQIDELAAYYSIYSIAAIATRVAGRKVTRRLGSTPTIVLGLICLAVGLVAMWPIRTGADLWFAGIMCGLGHGVVYPFLTAAGTARFPQQHRGLGTTMMIAVFDFGQFVGAPIFGTILALAARAGVPPYPTLLVIVAAVLVATAVGYAWVMRRERHEDTSAHDGPLAGEASPVGETSPALPVAARSMTELPAAVEAED